MHRPRLDILHTASKRHLPTTDLGWPSVAGRFSWGTGWGMHDGMIEDMVR